MEKVKVRKKETGKPNFANCQTDIGYMGKRGTAVVHSRLRSRRQYVLKTSMNCMLPQCTGGRRNHPLLEMPGHLGLTNAALGGLTQLFLINSSQFSF